jgi:sigma-E factor negative regulatory protein RseB
MSFPNLPVLLLSLFGGALLAVPASAEERTPAQWLDMMNRGFLEASYDGIFSYFSGDDLSTMRVVHTVTNGVQRERLVHLNGAPREIVRTGDEVECILRPGDEILALESSIPSGPFARAFSRAFEGVSDNYTLSLHGTDRVANREAVRLAVMPRDAQRYGFRLGRPRHRVAAAFGTRRHEGNQARDIPVRDVESGRPDQRTGSGT